MKLLTKEHIKYTNLYIQYTDFIIFILYLIQHYKNNY